MANHAIDKSVNPWGGGVSPFNMSYGKMMMWFFLVSDALSFTGLLVALGFSKHRLADVWPDSGDVFFHFPFVPHDNPWPLIYVAFMTFILIMSSVTMVLAVEAGHRMSKKGVTTWLFLTIIGGFIFLGSQVWEWSTFIIGTSHEGGILATITQNPYGPAQYGQFFFLITGFHGFHVFSGVIINIIIWLNVIKGTYEKRGHYEMIEKTGLYWHFVDLVWVFVFTFFYLV